MKQLTDQQQTAVRLLVDLGSLRKSDLSANKISITVIKNLIKNGVVEQGDGKSWVLSANGNAQFKEAMATEAVDSKTAEYVIAQWNAAHDLGEQLKGQTLAEYKRLATMVNQHVSNGRKALKGANETTKRYVMSATAEYRKANPK